MSSRSPRTICVGMLGHFSALPLEHMLTRGVEVCAVVVPSPHIAASSAPIRALTPSPLLPANLLLQEAQRNISQLAWDHRIPVFEVSDLRHAQTFTALADLHPDVIMVACFPFILPKRLLKLPTHGCFNLHPSLLPKLRGPAPLFWTFHEGVQPGVTLHLMSEQVDAGEIVAQTPLDFPDGIIYNAAEKVCAQAGATLIVDALRAIGADRLQTRPQLESEASYFPYPSHNDFIITPDWTAQRTFNFIRGVEGFGGSAIVQIAQQQFVVCAAIEYKSGEIMSKSYRATGDEFWLRCADGGVRVRVNER